MSVPFVVYPSRFSEMEKNQGKQKKIKAEFIIQCDSSFRFEYKLFLNYSENKDDRICSCALHCPKLDVSDYQVTCLYIAQIIDNDHLDCLVVRASSL